MLKIKISEISTDDTKSGSLQELEIKSFVIKKDKDDLTLSPETIKRDQVCASGCKCDARVGGYVAVHCVRVEGFSVPRQASPARVTN